MSDNLDKQTIDWHSGFYAAACFVLMDEPYELYKEYELNKQPLRIDVLIKSKDDKQPQKDIAKLFRRINIVEYKNPTDSLNYIQYYKTVAYASLYIGNSDLKDRVLPTDVTVSIFRDRYPKKLFRQLIANGCIIREYKSGIYYVEGKVLFPTQIVVISQLKGDEYLAFKALSDRLQANEAEKFIMMACSITDAKAKDNIDAVLQVSVNVNNVLYDKIKGAKPQMCQALMELMKEEVQQVVDTTTKETEVKGILITISSLRDFNLPEAAIKKKIIEKYDLDCSTAEKYMAMAASGSAKE